MKGRKYPDPQTILLNEVLKTCYAIKNLLKFVKSMPLDQAEKVFKLYLKTKIYYAIFLSNKLLNLHLIVGYY